MTRDGSTSAFVEGCARGFLERLRKRRARSSARADGLRERAARVARILVEDHGAGRVWLFGSLAWGEPHEASDVDLVVEGLAPDGWSRAVAAAEEIVGGPVDLVRAE